MMLKRISWTCCRDWLHVESGRSDYGRRDGCSSAALSYQSSRAKNVMSSNRKSGRQLRTV